MLTRLSNNPLTGAAADNGAQSLMAWVEARPGSPDQSCGGSIRSKRREGGIARERCLSLSPPESCSGQLK